VKESGGSIMADVAGVVGETLSVFVAVLVLALTVSSDSGSDQPTEEECKQIRQKCIDRCTEETIGGGKGGKQEFRYCYKSCLDAYGCWRLGPYGPYGTGE
jgi:hypothetical protein